MQFNVDRQKINDDLVEICDAGLELLRKKKLEQTDFGKLKTMKAMSSFMNGRIALAQQETARERTSLIRARMEQLGYDVNNKAKEIEG